MGVYVIPQYQGVGVGKALMKKAISELKGYKVKLVVHPENSNAIALYLKLGFKIHAWKDNYYKNGQPRLILELEN